ncbi:MAG: hypothetical protein MJ211_12185 [Bacteroidales bacterium]|nr:hypothetical protein [Bacteroidales bacterium]
MKKIFLISFLLFINIVNYGQNVCIDTCYLELNDTIIYKASDNNKKNIIEKSYINVKVYVEINKYNKCIYNRLSRNYNSMNREFSPRIIKIICNKYNNYAYVIKYYLETLTIEKINIIECLKNDKPQSYNIDNIIQINQEIFEYIANNYLKLKDIDVELDENYLTLRCYQYYKKFVIFRYDFNTKEWSILEDRKLTEEEVEKLGFYD